MHRGAVADLGHHTQVDLQAGAQDHRRARVALRNDFGDLVIGHEPLDHRAATLGRYQDIQVANGFLPPAIAACHGDLPDAVDGGDERDQRLGEILDQGEAKAPVGDVSLRQFVADPGLAFLAEAADARDPPRLGGLAQIVERADVEFAEQGLRALGADAGDRGDLDEAFGNIL